MRSFLITALLLAILPLIFCGSNDGGAGSAYENVKNGDLTKELDKESNDGGAGLAEETAKSGDVKVVKTAADIEKENQRQAIRKLTGQVHEMLNAVKSADDIKNSLPDINALRKDYAKALNISNMAKLTWNPSLATQASTTDCQDALGSKFRSFKFHRSLPKDGDILLHLMFDQPHISASEIFAPHQYQIGCVKKDCIPMDRPFYISENKQAKFEFNCLLGPSAIKPENAEKRGTPGSECGKGTNEDGLCVMEKASGSSEGAVTGGAMGTSFFSAYLIFLTYLML